MAWKSSFRQNYRTTFSPTVPISAAGISHVVADVEAPDGEKWEHLKSGGKQRQATPKNVPRMQRTRAIPVAWLNSGLCPDRPKGRIPIIITQIPFYGLVLKPKAGCSLLFYFKSAINLQFTVRETRCAECAKFAAAFNVTITLCWMSLWTLVRNLCVCARFFKSCFPMEMAYKGMADTNTKRHLAPQVCWHWHTYRHFL